jgi:hypothetical protein
VKLATLDDVPVVADLLNDPVIRPSIGGEGDLDPTGLIADRRNKWLFDERGGAVFVWRGPGIFEGHSFFRVRGREALYLGKAMLGVMFDNYEARMIWGATPLSNRPARWFNRQLGFQSLGEIETPSGRCELFSLETNPCQSAR